MLHAPARPRTAAKAGGPGSFDVTPREVSIIPLMWELSQSAVILLNLGHIIIAVVVKKVKYHVQRWNSKEKSTLKFLHIQRKDATQTVQLAYPVRKFL